MNDNKKGRKLSPSFVTGAIALAFLAVGYQTALFVHRAAALKILSDETVPDTVYVSVDEALSANDLPVSGEVQLPSTSTGISTSQGVSAGNTRQMVPDGSATRQGVSVISSRGKTVIGRKEVTRPETAAAVAAAIAPRTYENFRFNPNVVSVNDLRRLGFSLKQAESIDNYRKKGGKFRRKEDFAKSYVVADSVYRRLEKYIDIPLLDINRADSAEFDALPGIGGYFAAKMVEYRSRLGGYSCKEQLMEIYHLDNEKYSRFSDLITVGESRPFRLWSMPADSLKLHPYIRNWKTANAIVLYRDNNPRELWTVEGLRNAGILDDAAAARLSRCRIEQVLKNVAGN